MTRGLARAALALACAGLAAGCGTQTATVAGTGPPPVTVPLSTSLVTAQGTWAIAVMGGSAASDNNFWQLFVRPTGASRWSLATPPGVADNGGLVAAGGGTSLTVGFRPSQDLAFSPLATSTDDGKNWTPGLLGAGLAGTPGAIAVASSGRALALLQDGTIAAAPTASAAAAGQWTQLTTLQRAGGVRPGPLLRADERARRLVRTRYVPDGGGKLRAARCGGGLHLCQRHVAIGGASAARDVRRGPGAGARADRRFRRRRGAADGREQPARRVVDRDALDGIRSGFRGNLARDGVRCRRERVGAARRRPGGDHRRTRRLVAGAAAGAAGHRDARAAGPSGGQAGGQWATWATAAGSYDALAVSGSRLTVWRLAQQAWAKVQLITVPIQYGSSG